jgi:hypothetical protein
MNCAIAFSIGLDGLSPTQERFRNAGNSSGTLSSASFCKAGATSGADLSCSAKFFTEVNGRISSSHWMFSMSSCQSRRSWRISRRFKVGRGGRDELQSCASEESCQSDASHEIPKLRVL